MPSGVVTPWLTWHWLPLSVPLKWLYSFVGVSVMKTDLSARGAFRCVTQTDSSYVRDGLFLWEGFTMRPYVLHNNTSHSPESDQKAAFVHRFVSFACLSEIDFVCFYRAFVGWSSSVDRVLNIHDTCFQLSLNVLSHTSNCEVMAGVSPLSGAVLSWKTPVVIQRGVEFFCDDCVMMRCHWKIHHFPGCKCQWN